ncbi:MAG TPA: hypothetical protein VHA09_05480 [Nitrososphaera sp.]|nr:hypothetical protein [Nitrososphaera sp.]
MESALAPPVRLIEYPNDLSGCDSLEIGSKRLLYMCSNSDGAAGKKKHFVIVLGYYAGQREDFVTKDLMEPIDDDLSRAAIREALAGSLAQEYAGAKVFFL